MTSSWVNIAIILSIVTDSLIKPVLNWTVLRVLAAHIATDRRSASAPTFLCRSGALRLATPGAWSIPATAIFVPGWASSRGNAEKGRKASRPKAWRGSTLFQFQMESIKFQGWGELGKITLTILPVYNSGTKH